jgi:hypothetical protein
MKKSFLVFGVCLLVFMSCASQGNLVQPGKRANQAILSVPKTVVFNVEIADRKMPSMGAYWAQAFAHILDGGLFTYPIYGGAAISRFKDADKTIAEERPALEVAWQDQFSEDIAAAYAKQFSTQTVLVQYPVIDAKKLKLEYFTKANAATKAQIAKICAENQADSAVVIVGQVIHGTGGGQSTAVSTQLKTTLCVFNKNGEIVATGKTQTPMAVFNAGDLSGYVELFAIAQRNTENVLNLVKK